MKHLAAHSYLAGKTAIISGGVFLALALPLLSLYPPLFASAVEVSAALIDATLIGAAFVLLGAMALAPMVVLQVPGRARSGAVAGIPVIAAVAWKRRQLKAAALAAHPGFLRDDSPEAALGALRRTLDLIPVFRETLDVLPVFATQPALSVIAD